MKCSAPLFPLASFRWFHSDRFLPDLVPIRAERGAPAFEVAFHHSASRVLVRIRIQFLEEIVHGAIATRIGIFRQRLVLLALEDRVGHRVPVLARPRAKARSWWRWDWLRQSRRIKVAWICEQLPPATLGVKRLCQMDFDLDLSDAEITDIGMNISLKRMELERILSVLVNDSSRRDLNGHFCRISGLVEYADDQLFVSLVEIISWSHGGWAEAWKLTEVLT